MSRFGVGDRDRLGNFSRSGSVDLLKRRTTEELYSGMRGACIAARQAFYEGHQQDHEVALVRIQIITAEIVKRETGREVHLAYDDTDHFEPSATEISG